MTPTPEHGEYRPGLGYYDHGRRGWVDHASKLTPVLQQSAPRPTTLRDALGGDPPGLRTREERQHAAHAGWKPSPEMESLRRLRDSDLPEERAQAQRLLAGHRRIALANYEAGLRALIDNGITLPEGVTPP